MTENEELCLKVAKLKGWTRIKNDGGGYFLGVPPGLKCGDIWLVPNWPGSIADAWRLVEEIAQGNIDCSIYVNNQYLSDSKYKCLFCEKNGRKTWSADSNTAPLAICKAYIAWRESQ